MGRMKQKDAGKPQVGRADLTVTILDRLLNMMRPVVIVGTILVLCLAILAMAWVFNKR